MILNRHHTVVFALSLTASTLFFITNIVKRIYAIYSRFALDIMNGLSVFFSVNR
jgi:hypothetical protein